MAAKYRTEISDEKLHELYLQHGRDASKLAPMFGCAPSTIRTRVRKMLARVEAHPIAEPRDPELINRVAELLQRSNVDPNTIQRIRGLKLKSYGVAIKNAEGRIETEGLYSTSFQADPIGIDDLPKWPVVAPAPSITIQYLPPTVIALKGLRIEVVLPDSQIGYQRDLRTRQFDGNLETYELIPTHDEAALDLATQLVAFIQPDGLTHVGDLLDNSEFSKYLQVEQFFRTTQASVDRAHRWLCDLKSAMGARTDVSRKRFRIVDGNHDEKRIATFIQQNARAAFGLRPANTSPQDWPDLTMGHLLRYAELEIETCGMWPGSSTWLVEGENGLVVVHDPQNKTAWQASVISGHTHHRRENSFTVRTPFGQRSYTHHEIGCLCSLKQIADPRSIQRTRNPSDRGFVKDWQQGIAVVEILEATGQHRLDFIPFCEGIAMYQKCVFAALETKAT